MNKSSPFLDKYFFLNSGSVLTLGITVLGYLTIFTNVRPLYLIIILSVYTPIVLLEIGCMQNKERFDAYIGTMFLGLKYIGNGSLFIGLFLFLYFLGVGDYIWNSIYLLSIGCIMLIFVALLKKKI